MKTFVTVDAVDGFMPCSEWTYKELQKQFGPNRIAKMKAAGQILEKEAYEQTQLAAAAEADGPAREAAAEAMADAVEANDAMARSLPSGARGAAEYDRAAAMEAAGLTTATAQTAGKPKKKVRGEWDLTSLQRQAMDAMYEIGADRTAAEIAEAMGMPGQAIKVSGILSSLVERGAVTVRKAKGTAGYWIPKSWYDGLGYSSRKA